MATPLRLKVKLALDETRMLVLGVQVLVGFGFQGVFEPRFAARPPAEQGLQLVALGLQLTALWLLFSPASWHQLAFQGEDSPRFHSWAMSAAKLALLPFSLALALALALAGQRVLGLTWAWGVGGLALLVTLGCWYGLGALARQHASSPEPQETPMEPTKVEDKVEQVLTEGKVVVPGAQALLGFQLAITLMDAFDTLPRWARVWHLGSLALVALATVLLMTPAAYHRIVERGEATERFHRVASGLLLAAMATLALGIASEVALVTWKVTHLRWAGAVCGALTVTTAAGLWFVLPLRRRRTEVLGQRRPARAEGRA